MALVAFMGALTADPLPPDLLINVQAGHNRESS